MAGRIMNLKDQLNESLNDPSKPWTKPLGDLEGKTGVNRLYIFIGGFAVLGLWLVFGFAGQLVCNGIGFLYPAYVSIHAIESPRKDDDTKWLTYWVVFAVFSVFEYFADMIVSWFPLYWLAKVFFNDYLHNITIWRCQTDWCTFFVWLMIPTDFNGSIVIYNKLVKPYFLKHHGAIDNAFDRVKASAGKVLEKEN